MKVFQITRKRGKSQIEQGSYTSIQKNKGKMRSLSLHIKEKNYNCNKLKLLQLQVEQESKANQAKAKRLVKAQGASRKIEEQLR